MCIVAPAIRLIDEIDIGVGNTITAQFQEKLKKVKKKPFGRKKAWHEMPFQRKTFLFFIFHHSFIFVLSVLVMPVFGKESLKILDFLV